MLDEIDNFVTIGHLRADPDIKVFDRVEVIVDLDQAGQLMIVVNMTEAIDGEYTTNLKVVATVTCPIVVS